MLDLFAYLVLPSFFSFFFAIHFFFFTTRERLRGPRCDRFASPWRFSEFFFCFVSFLFFIILLFGFMVSAVVFDHLGQSDENSVFAWIKRGGEGLLDPTLPLNE